MATRVAAEIKGRLRAIAARLFAPSARKSDAQCRNHGPAARKSLRFTYEGVFTGLALVLTTCLFRWVRRDRAAHEILAEHSDTEATALQVRNARPVWPATDAP